MSQASIRQAAREFDRLKAEDFRSTYKFGPADRYFVVIDGFLYDSKAIAGVAHGFENPDQGPLRGMDFSQSSQLRAAFERLGFQIRNLPRSERDQDFREGRSPGRNPAWERDELILALDLYLRKGMLGSEHPEVIALSQLLNRLPLHPLRPDADRFRNPNGVALKLANFAGLDPDYSGRGMSRHGHGDADVWEELADNPVLVGELAGAIREESSYQFEAPLTPEAEEDSATEGRLLFRRHRQRERDPRIVRRKKAQVLQATGRLACEACDLDFGELYGELGQGFIECHHTVPLSSGPERSTRLTDLVVVCSNCHRMIHRARPMMSVALLKELVS